ncbi:VOC family protein [Cetobacterium sp. SF1]|uniref:VOC family protein n=1 Tax=Cetobacterium sp. SF1 TaxID=3417654 RepID=UPI003CEA8E84
MIFHHVCIQTNNYKKSLDFYCNILGFQLVKETENFHGRYYNSWLKLDNFYIELQTGKENKSLREWSSDNEGPIHISFLVKDVLQFYKNIKDKGYNDFKKKNGTEEIYKVENSYLFKIKAPEGTEIEIREADI